MVAQAATLVVVDAISLRTDDGLTLEGEVHRPDATPAAKANAVICHPHPQHGGSKDHPLLWAIRISLVKRGFVVVTFNFRFCAHDGLNSDIAACPKRATTEVYRRGYRPLCSSCGWPPYPRYFTKRDSA
jgi:hypothetical protein